MSIIRYVFRRRYTLGRLEVRVEWRRKQNLCGRFGGGWNWRLGLQGGGRTVIISLFVLSIIICYQRKPES